MCHEHGKIPVMMPRKYQLNEHVDDHQQMLATNMAERGMILLAETEVEVETNILNYDALCASRQVERFPIPELARHLKSHFQKR